MPVDTDTLLELIASRCEMDEILDLCQVDAEELVELLRGHIYDNRRRFEEYLEVAYEGN